MQRGSLFAIIKEEELQRRRIMEEKRKLQLVEEEGFALKDV